MGLVFYQAINFVLVQGCRIRSGLFGDSGEPVAACFFSTPQAKWSESMFELIRLVRHPNNQDFSLTELISDTVKFIKKKKLTDLLISFADKSAGHHGGVYQAASWNYAGARDRACDGLIVEGTFIPGRTCNSLFGTRSPTKFKEKYPDKNVEPHYDEGKHLYWRALSKSGTKKAERLGLKAIAYPKPSLNPMANVLPNPPQKEA